MKKSILLFYGTLISFLSMGQGTINTHAVYPDNNGSSAVSFEVESSVLVEITGISNVFNSTTTSSDVWVRVGGILTAPLNASGNLEVTAANGWVLHQTGTVSGGGGSGSLPVPIQGLNPILIPANTPVGIVITGGMRYSGLSSPVSPSAFTHGPVTLRTGGTTGSGIWGYGGALPAALGNKPRGFLGIVTYGLVGPCTNPPVAGTATANSSLVCVGGNVDLSLTGNTSGTGQTYQWQSSPDNLNWTNISGATSLLATVNPTTNTYYRAGVTCGVTTYSTSVLITTQGGTLSGTYTINKNAPSSPSNFQSFGDLATALSCGNITADVIVNVVANSGPYKERVVLGPITGSGPTARLIINGNGNELRDSTNTTNDRTAFLLNGTDYLILDSLRIVNKGATYGWALQLTNGADNNIIRNCRLETSTSSTSSNHCGLVVSSSLTSATTTGNSGNGNLFEDNFISGGYYGLIAVATTTAGSRSNGNRFVHNQIQDFYSYGLYLNGQDSIMVLNNTISRPTRTSFTTSYGIYMGSVGNKSQVGYNWIHDMFTQGTTTTSALYGISSSAADNLPGDECIVYNNLISENENNGAHYYLYNTSSDGWKYYHNTVVSHSSNTTAGLTRGFYQTTAASGIEFKNNLISINRGGVGPHYAVYAGTSTSVMTIDRNAYYLANAAGGNDHIGYFSSNQTTLSSWQTSTGFDLNSSVGNPIFDPNSLYQPTAAYFNNIGDNVLSYVATDFGGNARTVTPDPGIWEFSPPPGPDLSIASITTHGVPCGNTTNVAVRFINVGTDTVLSATLNYSIDGVPQTPMLLSGIFATGISVYDTLYNIPLVANSNTTIVATLSNIAPGLDTDPTNNSITVQVRPGYSGNLVINASATPNNTTFNSFTELGAALTSLGICGPINVSVTPGSGPYNEQFMIGEIPGASAVNQIIINGNGETLQYAASSSSERGTVIFNGGDWFTINNLVIKATGTTYGFGISLFNNANNNTVSGCTIITDSTSTSTNYSGIVISGSPGSATTSGAAGNYNRILNNTIVGGYYGIIAYGASADSLNGNHFVGNTIRNFYYAGLYNYYSRKSIMSGNEIFRPSRTSNTTFYGIYAYVSQAGKIMGNKIHDPFPLNTTTTSAAYGIYAYGLIGNASDSAIMANNLIYNFNSAGTQYLFAPYQTSYAKVIHNTIIAEDPNSTGTSSTTYAIYNPGSSDNTNLQNNLVYLNRKVGSGSSYFYYQSGAVSASTVVDNNVYYSPSTFTISSFGYFGGGVISTFNDWKNNTGFDQLSQFSRPYFQNLAGGDFTPQSKAIDGAGVNFTSEVKTDINGTVRSIPVDPGAIEFTGAPCSGVSGLATSNITTGSATVTWNAEPTTIAIEWGPVGFKQASVAGTIINVPSGSAMATISGLSGNTCYEYYLTLNCTSTIPGAPPVMGPYSFCTPCVGGGLPAGTYTVGGAAGPSNFADIDSVISVLNGCGINGPVVFNVQAGSYIVTKTIKEIVGASALNTITFDGSATLMDTLKSSGTAVLDLNGAKHITFKGLNIVNKVGRGVWLRGNADSNTVMNCHVMVNTTGTSSAMAGIVASASSSGLAGGADVDYLTITGNTIDGGYYGIVSYGNSTTSKVNGGIIENNTLTNQYYYGLYAYYNQNISIKGNSVNGLRNTTSYGYYMVSTDNFSIEKNQTSGSETYGLYMSSSNTGLGSAPATRSTIINNMISSEGTGVYLTTVGYVDVYHNTVEGEYGYRQFTPTSVNVRNNIFVGVSNYAFESGTAVVAPNVVNYNLYHLRTGTNLIKDGTPTYASLALWKTAIPALNTYSIEGDPVFISTTDLHVVGSLANDVGDNTVGVPVDFDNDTRPASGSTVVDMGADEFTPLNYDITADLIISPKDMDCGDSNTAVQVIISNYGLLSASGITATATITGAASASLSGSYTGSLPALGSDTITFSSFNSAMGGTFNISVTVSMPSDQDASNNTVTTSVSLKDLMPRHPLAALDTVCAGQYDTLYWPANTVGMNFEWQTTTGNSLGVNDTLVVGPLGTNDTTFILKPVSSNSSVGPLNPSIGSYADVWNNAYGLFFDVLSPTQIVSVDVYPTGTGVIEFILEDAANNLVASAVVPITGGSQTSPFTAMLNFNVPVGTGYKLRPGTASTTHSIRNSTGGSYPYTIPGTLAITGNMFNNGPGPYYYYFYNWQVTTAGCSRPDGMKTIYASSASAIATFTSTVQNATATGQMVDFDASGSQGAATYSWNFGDGNTGTGAVTSHTYAADGTYTVTLTITGPCGSKTSTSTVTIVGIGIEENAITESLKVYPNPTNGVVSISFDTDDSEDVTFRITDMAGKEVWRRVDKNVNGTFRGEIDITKLPNGVYMLEVSSNQISANQRLIKR